MGQTWFTTSFSFSEGCMCQGKAPQKMDKQARRMLVILLASQSFRHDVLHCAEVIYLVSMLLLRNTIRWIHTRGCKMCNSLTAFKNIGWTPPTLLSPYSHFFWQPLFWTTHTLGARSRINQSHIKTKLWIWNRQNVPDFDVFGALSLESILQKSLNGFSW